MDLPSVEECRTFLDTINRGREAIGLDALTKLDFDDAKPSEGTNCLSARNLFAHADLDVGFTALWPRDAISPTHEGLARAIGVEVNHADDCIPIPDTIKVVTDSFDFCDEGLRERLVDAGVVDP